MIHSPDLPPGFRYRYFESIDSTNAEALRQAGQGGEDAISVFHARTQTAGRGRRGREWTSPPGNLHLSLLLRPGRPAAEAAQLSFVTAVALAETLVGLLPRLAVACKWPNDLLIQGHKVSGILLEASGDDMVIGLGVNLVAAPDPALYPATSLDQHGYDGSDVAVLSSFLHRFDHWLGVWRNMGFSPVRNAWLARCYGLGGPITVRLPDSTLQGTFTGLDESGALLLITADGNHKTIHAGDVFFGDGSEGR